MAGLPVRIKLIKYQVIRLTSSISWSQLILNLVAWRKSRWIESGHLKDSRIPIIIGMPIAIGMKIHLNIGLTLDTY